MTKSQCSWVRTYTLTVTLKLEKVKIQRTKSRFPKCFAPHFARRAKPECHLVFLSRQEHRKFVLSDAMIWTSASHTNFVQMLTENFKIRNGINVGRFSREPFFDLQWAPQNVKFFWTLFFSGIVYFVNENWKQYDRRQFVCSADWRIWLYETKR